MRLKEDLVLRHVGNDHVIVDPGQGVVDMSKVFTLNNSAAWLWEELMGREFTYETVVELLRERYNVSYEQAEQDAKKMIGIFEVNGLLSS